MSEHTWDVIVIGGGSAGLSAALTLGRARQHTLVIDAGAPRNRVADHTQGLLGHDGIDPAALLETGRAEIARYGVQLARSSVEKVEQIADGLRVTRADATTDNCRALIVASGMTDELPDIPGLAARWGTTVVGCPYCHGWEVRDQRLGVLATSALGLHQAQLIRQWSDHVVLFTADAGPLEDTTRARLTARRIRLVDSPVAQLLGDAPTLTGVRTGDGAVTELDALFTGGPGRPHDAFLTGLNLDRADTPMGSFLAVDATGKTSHPRIWAAGNVADPSANVARSISAGMWAAAAANAALVAEDFDTAEQRTAAAEQARR